jgi:glucosamine--fructose-6-phosphate aminotransferase (isomerizing)
MRFQDPAPPDRAALLAADVERVPSLFRAPGAAAGPGASGPGAVRQRAAGPRSERPRRVVLTGLGSSRFAALAVAPLFREAGLETLVEHASEARPVAVGRGTLVVAISASGRTPETIAALLRARDMGASTLAVTNRSASPLAEAAAAALDLAAGVELSGVSAVTYVATVAALIGLAASLGAPVNLPGLLADAAGAADELLAGRGAWLAPAADALDGSDGIHVIADAGALGAAEQAALLFRECPRLVADATDAGDWLHVGIYAALPGYRALLLGGTAYDAELASVITGRGGRLVGCGSPVLGAAATIPLPDGAGANRWVRALVEPLVPTLLAAELWSRVRATGREAAT